MTTKSWDTMEGSPNEQVDPASIDPSCPYCVPHACPEHQPLKAPAHESTAVPSIRFCGYEDCDQEPEVQLPGVAMCRHHAAVSLLAGMTPEEARNTFTFARPMPEDPWAPSAERTGARAHGSTPVPPEPDGIAIGGLFANEGRRCLRALFAWRAQGKLARWKTDPSRALASLADRLAIEYPDTTRSFREAGERDAALAAELAGTKVHATDLPKGPAYRIEGPVLIDGKPLPELQIACQCGELFAPCQCPRCERRHPPVVLQQRPMVYNAESRTFRQVEPEEYTDDPPYKRTAALLRRLRAERDGSRVGMINGPALAALDAVLDAFAMEDPGE